MTIVEKSTHTTDFGDNSDVRWIPSACGFCYAQCSILVKVKNGVVMKIEGNPDSPVGAGKLCPKGVSGIMTLYDPNRVNVPLMRTNPEKGIGVDPKWKEISWEEANEIIVERLKAIRADNPNKLFLTRTTTISTPRNSSVWMSAFGSPNISSSGGGLHCGNGTHLIGGMFHGSWSVVPDFSRCDYAILFGASKGHSAGHSTTSNAGLAADARARGMQLVVVDPMRNHAAAKGSEWVPIRVGTDAALALGMANVILNEVGIWDAEHLRQHTNGIYLIGPDGHYVRDPDSNKPLVWDAGAGKAVAYDAPHSGDLSLLGSFTVQGVPCQPGFQLIKDHVRKFTPEYVEQVTTVPAEQVRRLGTEFAARARVGVTIEIDGEQLPLRPVAAIFFRGAQGHKGSVWTSLAVEMLNQIVGAADVPGGALGFNPVMHGRAETGRPSYEPYAGPDGLLAAGIWLGSHLPFPPSNPKVNSLTLTDTWPLARASGFFCSSDQEEIWSGLGVPYRPEMMLNVGANPVLTVGNPETAVEALKKVPFMVSFDLFLTEFSELCDIVLPDASSFERWDVDPQWPPLHDHPSGPGDWAWPIRQPVVPLIEQRRDFQEVLLDWAYRAGFGNEYHAMMNLRFPIEGKWALANDRQYSWEEICDHRLKSMFGNEHGLEWFGTNGLMRWPKRVKEVYWRPFVKARVPIYCEVIKTVGEQQKALLDKTAFPYQMDWSLFEPLPDWTPCNSHRESRSEFDLWAFYYRDVLHTNSFTYENPWLDELAAANPFSYHIAINNKTAARKGLKSGDWVVAESGRGRTMRGRIITTDTIHPEAMGIGGCGGHYTKYQPIALGKGVRFNDLLEIEFDNMDPVNLSLDLCVKVKVCKDSGPFPDKG